MRSPKTSSAKIHSPANTSGAMPSEMVAYKSTPSRSAKARLQYSVTADQPAARAHACNRLTPMAVRSTSAKGMTTNTTSAGFSWSFLWPGSASGTETAEASSAYFRSWQSPAAFEALRCALTDDRLPNHSDRLPNHTLADDRLANHTLAHDGLPDDAALVDTAFVDAGGCRRLPGCHRASGRWQACGGSA